MTQLFQDHGDISGQLIAYLNLKPPLRTTSSNGSYTNKLVSSNLLPELDFVQFRNVEKQYHVLQNQREYFRQKLASTKALRDAVGPLILGRLRRLYLTPFRSCLMQVL